MTVNTAATCANRAWRVAGLTLLSFGLLIPDLYAQVDSNVGNYICLIADNFTGSAGRGIATIGISVIGTLACLGRVTWTQAIVVGVGVAVLFSASTFLTQLGAGGTCP